MWGKLTIDQPKAILKKSWKMLSNLAHIFINKIKLPTGALGTINLRYA